MYFIGLKHNTGLGDLTYLSVHNKPWRGTLCSCKENIMISRRKRTKRYHNAEKFADKQKWTYGKMQLFQLNQILVTEGHNSKLLERGTQLHFIEEK